MNLKDAPFLQLALADVLPIIPAIWRSFDEATTTARIAIDGFHTAIGEDADEAAEDSDTHSRVYDPHLFPHIVRYYGKLALIALPSYDLSVEEIRADNIPLSGLRLKYGRRIIHIRKATPDGGIPEPDGSRPTQSYYQAILSEEFVGGGVDLLFLWHATPFGIFKGLSLVCAIPGKRTIMQRVLGIIQFPDPAETILYQGAPVGSPRYTKVLADLGDLPIELLTSVDGDVIGDEGDAEQLND